MTVAPRGKSMRRLNHGGLVLYGISIAMSDALPKRVAKSAQSPTRARGLIGAVTFRATTFVEEEI